jgi:hypothetical protein
MKKVNQGQTESRLDGSAHIVLGFGVGPYVNLPDLGCCAAAVVIISSWRKGRIFYPLKSKTR